MKYDRVYIDFYGGAHGHFLEYVVNRYLLNVASADFTPFVPSGASHQTTPAYQEDRKAFSDHYSPFNLTIAGKNNLIVQIHVDLFYPVLYNSILRAGDVSLDIDNLELDTLDKLCHKKHRPLKTTIISTLGEQKNYPRKALRNIFYSKFIEKKFGVEEINRFLDYKQDVYVFPFSAFYDYGQFVEQLGLLSTKLGKISWNYTTDLSTLWQEFISMNQGYKSYIKCNSIIESIIKNQNKDFSCDLLEEAYINSYITKTFNLYSDIDCFEDKFINNTKEIYQAIVNQINYNRKANDIQSHT
jgi:hypothetical protein